MIDEFLINDGLRELRVALVRQGQVRELLVHRHDGQDGVGEIYRGRITSVAPAMAGAFVDLGLPRPGFLPRREADFAGLLAAGDGSGPAGPLVEGQAIVVQIIREADGEKGVRVTTDITVAGHLLAFAPGRDSVAISRRIGDAATRTRLEQAIAPHGGPGMGGFIVRTAAADAHAPALDAEATALKARWRTLRAAAQAAKGPARLDGGDRPVVRALRDHMSQAVGRVWFDQRGALAEARRYCEGAMPWALDRLALHDATGPLFDRHDVEADIEAALEADVALRSGGWCRIEGTEALTAIDVNAGGRAAGRNAEETALAINLEAAEAIARQLCLRDIGGIVVIDLLRLRDAAAQRRVAAALRAHLDEDRAPTRVGEISSFGLLEMTRRRQRRPLADAMTEPCATCAGTGRRMSIRAISDHLLRRAEAEAAARPGRPVTILAAPAVVDDLGGANGALAARLAARIGARVTLTADPSLSPERFEISHGQA